MQLSLLFNVIIVALSSQLVSACGCSAKYNRQNPGRTSSILNNPDAQPDLPTLPGATGQANANGLNLTNIQGDILVGMKKKQELFLFFTINEKDHFKQHLGKDILPLITSTAKLLDVKTQPITAVNIAFSQDGLNALGVSDSLHDQFFTQGQAKDANFLGDPGTENWVSIFATENVHGVFLLASDDVKNVNDEVSIIEGILGSSITEVYRLQGASRPGAFEGHEHFGFMDGISQPAVKGFTTKPLPGQAVLDPGHFLVGTTGDSKQSSRPQWAAEGSFLAFRQLQQKVPEFNAFIKANALKVPGLSQQENEDLLGARMIGRWKSGAPVDLAPLKDDPTLGADPQRNNNFDFTHPGKDLSGDQMECPFSAHIRKTRPRADFSPENTANHIIRAGIPYGPEVTDAEAASGQSDPKNERGLAFVSYQSDIGNGYRFQQNTWSNNINFSFGKNDTTPGFDPIVGANNGKDRFFSGLDPLDANHDLSSKIDFVVSRGGQYFFTPSLSAIGGALSS